MFYVLFILGSQVSVLWVSSVDTDDLNFQMLWKKENREHQDKVIEMSERGKFIILN